MRLKLTKTQLEGLHLILTQSLNRTEPDNIPDALIHELVDKLNERVRSRVRKAMGTSQNGYGLTLNSVEAKALYCWWMRVQDDEYWPMHYRYESIVMNKVAHDIDREYA
jgi:hypothetical protein